jgi:DNA polymerase-3 subunit beta
MNIVCEKESLLKMLSIAINAINERSTVDALKCFKLESKNNFMIITANNLETNIVCKVAAKTNKEGLSLVHAKTFYNIISKLPPGDVSMYLSENQTLLLQCGNSTFNIYTMKEEEFPEDMTIEDPVEIKIDPLIFKNIIRHVYFSASDEEEKIILNGVLLEQNKENNELIFVAADGYRLAKDKIVFQAKQSQNTIIPIKTIKEIVSIIGTYAVNNFSIMVATNKIKFICDDIQIYSRVITGKFPDYKMLIPQEHNLEIIIDRKEFLESCDRMNIIALKNSYMVKIEILDHFFVISTVTPDFGDGSEKINVQIKGDDSIQVVFNVKLMIEALKNLESNEVVLHIINDEKPICMKEKDNPDYLYIMMPIKVKRDS